ncbi:lytic transglycosylase domain-containing protein, partial [Herbiconiux daphne]
MAITPYNYGALIQNAAKKYGVDPELIQSVIKVESGGNPTAASGTGPVGLMQISEGLAKDYGYNLKDRLDPAKNIDMGARYLAQNLKAFGGDTTKALLGYNQGTGGANSMIAGRKPLAPEGAKYIQNPAFQKFTTGGIPATLHSIANPVAALEESKPKDQYSSALLQRDAALAAPTQAQAMAGQATPITAQQAQQVNQQQQEGDNNDHWGDAALALASMLAPRQKSQSTQTWSGLGRG